MGLNKHKTITPPTGLYYQGVKVEQFAHRGYLDLRPENTLCAFQNAINLGCDGIELDINFSLDGYVMVIHDTTINRTTYGSGNVKDYTLAQLRTVDAGRKFNVAYTGEKIPTLQEVFALVRGKINNLQIDIKGYRTQADLIILNDLIVSSGMSNVCILASDIGLSDLQYIRNINTTIKLCHELDTNYVNLDTLASLGNCSIMFPYASCITNGVGVDNARARGVNTVCSEINSQKTDYGNVQALISKHIYRWLGNRPMSMWINM